MDAARLVKMANQIADNQRVHGAAAARLTAEHLRAFWTPAMRRELAAYVAAGGQGVSEIVKEAVGEG